MSEATISLAQHASASGHLLPDREWRHRQVDSLVITENLSVRTRTSVDFSIPENAPEFRPAPDREPERAFYYLPIAVLAKWPPLANFDLVDENGATLPLLTKRRNRLVDAAALRSIVPNTRGGPRDEMLDALTSSVEANSQDAPGHLQRFTELLPPLLKAVSVDERIMWAIVKGWVSVLSSSSLLWVPVRGKPGDRRVVKFAFEQPLIPALLFWRRVEQSFSFAPALASVTIPNIAAYRSYHLQFEPPRDLQVISVDLITDTGPQSTPPKRSGEIIQPKLMESVPVLYRRFLSWFVGLLKQAYDELNRKLRRYLEFATERKDRPVRTSPGLLEPAPGTPYKSIARGRVHLYVSEPPRSHPFWGVQIGIRAARRGVITGTFIASVLIAIVMSTYAILADTVIEEHLPAGVTVLVLVPGLIGYLAVRPDEHPLLRRHVRSVRLLLLLAASVPMTAAVLLVTVGGEEVVRWTWVGLAAISWALAGMLAISWLLPSAPLDEP